MLGRNRCQTYTNGRDGTGMSTCTHIHIWMALITPCTRTKCHLHACSMHMHVWIKLIRTHNIQHSGMKVIGPILSAAALGLLCSLLSALCSLLYALCSLLSSLFSILYALCSLLSALYSLFSTLCCAVCCLLSALSFTHTHIRFDFLRHLRILHRTHALPA
jgi:hypothetical protein